MNNIIQQKLKEPIKDSWLNDLSHVITDLETLLTRLNLNHISISTEMVAARKQFPIRVPEPYFKRIEKSNPNDPLLLQVLAQNAEMDSVEGFSVDPLQEQESILPNLLHKYHNRALIIFKTACAINCRYCFRRHFPYQSHNRSIEEALNYIRSHIELDEIILSGGDPLMAKDHELERFIKSLSDIPHIKRLRIHSRLPVVIPSRVTQSLCELFQNCRLKVILVTHINHPNEIDSAVIEAMNALKRADVTLLNQSVLLKGINDDVKTLKSLSETLFDKAGILPYYLHLLDHVHGAAHFYVDDDEAKSLMRELAANLSGFLLPKLAREIGGERNKRLINY